MVESMSSSGQMVMPPRWSNGFVSRDLILRDDWEDEMNDTSTPKYSDGFVRDQSSLKGGGMWNFAALIEYMKSADAGFIPIEGDIKVEDTAVVSDAGVEEITLNGVSIGAK
uniref:Uncharacterized protein n=1 Tax=Plectus sambesii TaxID=2011161 RepID=A0A914WD30_9BILA